MKKREIHGMARTAEYRAWAAMISRCGDESVVYRHYGARGISVCDRWRNSFAAFYHDMGPRPSSAHSLDRWPNNDGNYEPGNCRWATRSEQMRNVRSNRNIAFEGHTKTAAEWEAELGAGKHTIRSRIDRGWSLDEAMKTPIGGNIALPGSKNAAARLNEAAVRSIRSLYATGVTQAELAAKFGVCPASIHNVVCGVTWSHVK
jgi:hypothetical protein